MSQSAERRCRYCGEPVVRHTSHMREVHPEKADVPCPTCGDLFHTEGGMKRHHAMIHGESISLADGECEVCGAEYQYYPSTTDGRFCSGECEVEFLETCRPQEHPGWEGVGSRRLYDSVRMNISDETWTKIRTRYLHDECRMCGSSGPRLALHHIVPLMAGGTNEQWNLITLCPVCHMAAEMKSREISEKVLTPDNDDWYDPVSKHSFEADAMEW